MSAEQINGLFAGYGRFNARKYGKAGEDEAPEAVEDISEADRAFLMNPQIGMNHGASGQ